MSNLQSLAVAVEVSERKRDEARRVLQDALAAQQAARAQLDQLEDYARETEARWGMKADTAMQPEVMYHHYQFMARLGHAAGMQTGVVGDHAGRVDAAQRALLDAELRLASLRKVMDKRRYELELAQARRDQKQTDERAALQYSNASRSSVGQE
ncbi:flagellar export protein FliJ [Acidovorax sp. sic0104]|uniref:flagellar export protein FliJ n=1 Tax=Acidovorax sp. sic0104 TaxID=2854784 RepID=UPI001C4749A5|nr:flagellar export protein FliJ [Acidovorax sp. sic0104]MBV7544137.1 flagellar export protein FliJ [Acidovorax sp. sic0104]